MSEEDGPPSLLPTDEEANQPPASTETGPQNAA
jgi:hypothetical protein